AFQKALQVNNRFQNIEVSGNFVLGANLPDSHTASLFEHLGKTAAGGKGKMTVYCSPLSGEADRRKLLGQFREMKRRSFHDTWLYLIQRL
ncbi:MAG: radical SAM protein, partial [Deltaproteobacteria bacterium]